MNSQCLKTCEVCQEPFEADRRVGERQRVCKRLSCQQERKRRAQKGWLAKNPGYFKGRYPDLKVWLDAHPGYLKKYRQRKQQLAIQPSRDIQDELSPKKNNHTMFTTPETVDIQDEITVKITMRRVDFHALAPVIYKTSEPPVFQRVDSP